MYSPFASLIPLDTAVARPPFSLFINLNLSSDSIYFEMISFDLSVDPSFIMSTSYSLTFCPFIESSALSIVFSPL